MLGFCFPLLVREGYSRPRHQLKSMILQRFIEHFIFNSTLCFSLNTAGIKSSLRRPSAPATSSFSSSSLWSGRGSLDIPATASKSQDDSVSQDSSRSSSPVRHLTHFFKYWFAVFTLLLWVFPDTTKLLFWYVELQFIHIFIYFFDISLQKSDCPPTESECSENTGSELAEEVINHPDGKVQRFLTTWVDDNKLIQDSILAVVVETNDLTATCSAMLWWSCQWKMVWDSPAHPVYFPLHWLQLKTVAMCPQKS